MDETILELIKIGKSNHVKKALESLREHASQIPCLGEGWRQQSPSNIQLVSRAQVGLEKKMEQLLKRQPKIFTL